MTCSALTSPEIIPPEFFFEFLVPVDNADASFHPALGRESVAALAHRFEKKGRSSTFAVDMRVHFRPF